MKKLINTPEDVVDEMLDGMLALNPALVRLVPHNVLLRADRDRVRENHVALISGGGSGHEPAHAGFVGPGMLSAAVVGQIFTSPSVSSVTAAIRAVAGPLGALLIVKNYTGDRLNFGLAAEIARSEGTLVETVVVADDVALAATEENAGRRGIAGTVFVHKIAGAAAAQGKDLPQVAALAQAAAQNVGSMGVSLSAGTSPAVGKPSFTLGDEVELGLGIHGEPGVRRVPLQPVDALVDELLHPIIRTLGLRPGERCAVLVNNLGATTTMELAIAARRALSLLASRGLIVERLYSGALMTSLDMAGLSFSLLRVDDERLALLDAPTAAPAWPNGPRTRPSPILERWVAFDEPEQRPLSASTPPLRGTKVERAITAACDALLGAESRLTELDSITGDGDLGLNMARAARAVQSHLASFASDSFSETLKALGLMLQEVLGGSSGPLYGVLLVRAANSLDAQATADPRSWAAAMLEGCDAVGELGGASLGHRTMLDALVPFARTFASEIAHGTQWPLALSNAVRAAERGAENTASMIARRGRSSYLGERVLGTPDPGAVAAAVWLRAVSSALV